MLFLSLVRGSNANQGAAIFWQLIEISRLLGGVYTELYRVVCRALSAIQNNGVSAFQGEVHTDRIGPIVETLESVHIIEVSAFQGCPQGRVPLYTVYCNTFYSTWKGLHVLPDNGYTSSHTILSFFPCRVIIGLKWRL